MSTFTIDNKNNVTVYAKAGKSRIHHSKVGEDILGRSLADKAFDRAHSPRRGGRTAGDRQGPSQFSCSPPSECLCGSGGHSTVNFIFVD